MKSNNWRLENIIEANTIFNNQELKINVNNFKLKSKTIKHGYANISTKREGIPANADDDKGIFLYAPHHTRYEITCFYLEQIIITKPEIIPEDKDWLEQYKKNTILKFRTRDDDTLTLDLSNKDNITKFLEDYFYLFNTSYITKKSIQLDNYFVEYVSLLLHEIYHQFQIELYSLFNGVAPYNLSAEGTLCQDTVKGTVTITDCHNQTVTDGEITVQSGEISNIYNVENENPVEWTIPHINDENIIITYTNPNGITITTELNSNGLKILPSSQIIMNDIVLQYGDIESVRCRITSGGIPVPDGTITFNIQNEQDTITETVEVNNGLAQFTPDYPPAVYSIQATYTSDDYETSNITRTLTINKATTNIIVDNIILTVDSVTVLDAYITDQNNQRVTTHINDAAVKLGGMTTLVKLSDEGAFPEYTSNRGKVKEGTWGVWLVAGINKYRGEARVEVPVHRENSPLWNLFKRRINNQDYLKLTTVGFISGQIVDLLYDEEVIGTFTVEDNTGLGSNIGEGTSRIPVPSNLEGKITLTLSAELQDGKTYTEDVTLTI